MLKTRKIIGPHHLKKDGSRRCDPQYVYFVHSPGMNRVKIGIAANPEKRLCDLQVGSPDRLVLAATWRVDCASMWEKKFHFKFASLRSHGEWFDVDERLQGMIDSAVFMHRWKMRKVVIGLERFGPERPPVVTVIPLPGESINALMARLTQRCTEAGIPFKG